jgi:hypothetical protein
MWERRAVERRERVWVRAVVAGSVAVAVPGVGVGGGRPGREEAMLEVVPLVRVRERRMSRGVGRWPSYSSSASVSSSVVAAVSSFSRAGLGVVWDELPWDCCDPEACLGW